MRNYSKVVKYISQKHFIETLPISVVAVSVMLINVNHITDGLSMCRWLKAYRDYV